METKAVAKPLRAAQSGSEPEQIGLAPEPEPLDQLSRWSRAVSGPSRAVTTLVVNPRFAISTSSPVKTTFVAMMSVSPNSLSLYVYL